MTFEAGRGVPGWPREEILAEARRLLRLRGREARREIVRTALELDRLLAEGDSPPG